MIPVPVDVLDVDYLVEGGVDVLERFFVEIFSSNSIMGCVLRQGFKEQVDRCYLFLLSHLDCPVGQEVYFA